MNKILYLSIILLISAHAFSMENQAKKASEAIPAIVLVPAVIAQKVQSELPKDAEEQKDKKDSAAAHSPRTVDDLELFYKHGWSIRFNCGTRP